MAKLSKRFIQSIKQIIFDAQNNAVRAVNQQRVLMYWHIGKHIVEEEQQRKRKGRIRYVSYKKLIWGIDERIWKRLFRKTIGNL